MTVEIDSESSLELAVVSSAPASMKQLVISRASASSFITRLGADKLGLVVAAAVCAALVLAFGLLAEEVMEGDTHKLDLAILMAFRTPGNATDPLGPAWFEEVVRDLTALGSYSFIIIVMAASLGYLLLVRKYALSAVVLIAVLGGIVVSNLLKHGFDRPRPDLQHAAQVFSPSFPSGHATLSAVTFLTIGGLFTHTSFDWRLKSYFLVVAAFLTIVVGMSRVYLGVHYPSDVLAGWCIGTAWALLCWAGAVWLQSRGDIEPPSGPSTRD